MTGLPNGGRQSRRHRLQSSALVALCAALLAFGGAGVAQASPPASGQYKLHVPTAGQANAPGGTVTAPASNDSGSGALPLVLAGVAVLAAVATLLAYRRGRGGPGDPA